MPQSLGGSYSGWERIGCIGVCHERINVQWIMNRDRGQMNAWFVFRRDHGLLWVKLDSKGLQLNAWLGKGLLL